MNLLSVPHHGGPHFMLEDQRHAWTSHSIHPSLIKEDNGYHAIQKVNACSASAREPDRPSHEPFFQLTNEAFAWAFFHVGICLFPKLTVARRTDSLNNELAIGHSSLLFPLYIFPYSSFRCTLTVPITRYTLSHLTPLWTL